MKKTWRGKKKPGAGRGVQIVQWTSADGLSVRGGTMTSSCSVSQAGWPVQSPRAGRHLQTATRGPISTKPGPLPLLPFHCAARDPAASERCSSALPVPHTLPPPPLVPLSPHSLSSTPPCVPRVPKLWYHGTGQTTCRPLPPRVVGPVVTEKTTTTCVTGGCYLFGKSWSLPTNMVSFWCYSLGKHSLSDTEIKVSSAQTYHGSLRESLECPL